MHSEQNENEYAASQLPIPSRKRSKRGRRHSNHQEDDVQVPISLRKAPPETLIEKEVTEDDGLQSQIPLPKKRSPKKLIGSQNEQDEEKEGDDFGLEESQIPLPKRRRKSKIASPQTSPKKKQNIEDTEDDLMEMSQMPLKAKEKPTRGTLGTKQKPTRTSPSRRKLNDDSDDSSDDWMQVRKTKSKSKSRSKAPRPTKQMKPTDDESAEDDEPPSSQPSGEGSEETVPQQLPPIQPQTKRRSSDKQPVAAKGIQEDDDYFENANDEFFSDSNDEDEILLSQEETKQQKEPAFESNDKPLHVGHQVRFSVALSENENENEPVVDDLDNKQMTSKAFAIGETSPATSNVNPSTEYDVEESIDNNSENGEEQKRKKRKSSFDMGQFLQDTKKQALSWL